MQKSNKRSKAKQRRRKRRMNAVHYALGGALILFGTFVILRDRTDLFNKNTASIPEATFPPDLVIETNSPLPTAYFTESIESVAPLPSPTPTPEPASQPVSVYFEGHDIAVAVVPVGVNEKGEMDTIPRHDIAGWYEYGAAPNEEGNCIIAGHNRYHGQKGLFAILHKGLKVGDGVSVTLENGETLFYKVVSIDRYQYNEVPEEVMADCEGRRLTLITCLGDFDYDLQMSRTRIVAICEPIQ